MTSTASERSGVPAAALDLARSALARGDNLRAHDLARSALVDDPDDLLAAHTLVVALARSGATRRAEEEFDHHHLDDVSIESALRGDLLALHARLAKDRAISGRGGERLRWSAIARDRYLLAVTQGDGGYAEVNAATMAAIAGDQDDARTLARAALRSADQTSEDPDALQNYWRQATKAEAWAVLGEGKRAAEALARAAMLAADDIGARSSTRRQLALLARVGLADQDLVDQLPMPGVVAYGGHRFLDIDEDEASIATRMAALLRAYDVQIAHGSLASGADTLWAEALLARGAELHIILPYDAEEFVDRSVRPAGSQWIERHQQVLAKATSATVSSPGPSLDDDGLYSYCASHFLGRAIVRSEALGVTPRFLVAWDGSPGSGTAGTAADVQQWSATGFPVDIVDIHREPSEPSPAAGMVGRREIRAALFGDFEGFSGVPDVDIPAFVDRSLRAISTALDAAGDSVLFRNSWGDGIYVVCENAVAAADLALAMQEAVPTDGPSSHSLRLRLGGHVGPTFRLYDPIQRRDTWWGRAVVTAARIEPRTPAGEVFVTEAFAALVAIEAGGRFSTEYAGMIDTAKGYGTLPMYVLKRSLARPT